MRNNQMGLNSKDQVVPSLPIETAVNCMTPNTAAAGAASITSRKAPSRYETFRSRARHNSENPSAAPDPPSERKGAATRRAAKPGLGGKRGGRARSASMRKAAAPQSATPRPNAKFAKPRGNGKQ